MPDQISAAVDLALTAHAGQMYGRHPYIIHPLEVGVRLMNAGAGADQVSVGLMHDVLEDSKTTYEQILAFFGPDVADAVAQMTHDPLEEYGSYARDLDGMAAIGKVFDSACNLLHLHELPPEKQPAKRERYRRNVAHHHHVALEAGLTPDIQVMGIISESLVAFPEGWDS